MFRQKVIQYINEKHLFHRSDKILVALSGGADSVALLRVLLLEGYKCVAAHCNFHLRDEESDRDEEFVQNLCRGLDVPLQVIHSDTNGYASRKRISIEMAARELRYEWFEQVRLQIGASVIAVAHHRDDSVETFLLNLVRGTGINGLKGIAAVNGKVVRPLLDVSRDDILAFLADLKQDYVTDSTNLEDEYLRNKLRLNVIPLLKEINPSVCESITETARRLSDVEAVYRRSIQTVCTEVTEREGKFSIFRINKRHAKHIIGVVISYIRNVVLETFARCQLKEIAVLFFLCMKGNMAGIIWHFRPQLVLEKLIVIFYEAVFPKDYHQKFFLIKRAILDRNCFKHTA